MVRPWYGWMHSVPKSMQDSMNGYALERFYESCSYAMDVCIWRVWVTDCISVGAMLWCMAWMHWDECMWYAD